MRCRQYVLDVADVVLCLLMLPAPKFRMSAQELLRREIIGWSAVLAVFVAVATHHGHLMPAPGSHRAVVGGPPVAMLVVPATSPTPTRDPCTGRGWSLAHPLRVCGRIRLVPADPTQRRYFYGAQLAALLDAYVSAEGQHALFLRRQVAIQGVAHWSQTSTVCFSSCYLYTVTARESYSWWGPAFSGANQDGFSSPANAETDPLMKPFASGFTTYLLGSASLDIAQRALLASLPALGFRGIDWDEAYTQDVYAHLEGAASWLPTIRAGVAATKFVSACEALASKIAAKNSFLPMVQDDLGTCPLSHYREGPVVETYHYTPIPGATP